MNGSDAGFIDAYDWDTLLVSSCVMQFKLDLCTGIFPCSLSVRGVGVSVMLQQGPGSFSCLRSSGCYGIVLENLHFTCLDDENIAAILKVQGSLLTISNSTFIGCASTKDGSIVQSYDSAFVLIRNCIFQNVGSHGFGGAISAVGSHLQVFQSHFLNCSSSSGGGAIWASTYACYGTERSEMTTLLIDSCLFRECRSPAATGGALSVSSDNTDSSNLGASLVVTVKSSVFVNCSATTGGGLMLSGVSVNATLFSCRFSGLHSTELGGGICIVGSRLRVESSEFVAVMSAQGGGCISVANSQGIGISTSKLAILDISSSLFQSCNSSTSGGAILVSSDVIKMSIDVRIQNTSFVQCLCLGNGGALAGSGAAVIISVSDSYFDSCHTAEAGGAISIVNNASLNIELSSFVANEAAGAGGGAIHVSSAHLHVNQINCTRNSAFKGGGGALLWDGDILSPFDIVHAQGLSCDEQNTARYGPCAASKYSTLFLNGLPLESAPAFAGVTIRLYVSKKDIYNQTILTDSSSVLQALNQAGPRLMSGLSGLSPVLSGTTLNVLDEGTARFDLIINPVFSMSAYEAGKAFLEDYPIVVFKGIDAEVETISYMQSAAAVIPIANGSSVCPKGYILALDSFGTGSCSECRSGTYSVSPLAGIRSGVASCLACLPFANCTGGSSVTFALGVWEVIDGMYRLVSCPLQHQLVNSINGLFNHDIQQCLACGPNQYILDSNNSEFSCLSWNYQDYVEVDASLPLSPSEFSAAKQLDFAIVLAKSTSVTVQKVMVNVLSSNRRLQTNSVQITSKIAADNASSAIAMSSKIDETTLNSELNAAGLPGASQILVTTVLGGSQTALPITLIAGISVSGFFVLVTISGFGLFLVIEIRKRSANKAFLVSFQKAEKGKPFAHLPYDLTRSYKPENVLGKGSGSCVISSISKQGNRRVAIKLVVPGNGRFDDKELRQLQREAIVLDMFTERNSEYAVKTVGIEPTNARKPENLCWFIMELLEGDDLATVVQKGGPLDDSKCIKVTTSVLCALKLMHSENMIHCDIKPSNMMECIGLTGQRTDSELHCIYKLIDFGSSICVNEHVATSTMMTVTVDIQKSVDTIPYMSPEMFKGDEISYPTDLWSLGVSMFELVTGVLPFQADTLSPFICNMNLRAPCVLDKLKEDQRPIFDHNLAMVIDKALEKNIGTRFKSVDDMLDAVYACLIKKGEAVYSVFISYRVTSELPLARLLFDELNHSVTPGGHRVTVFWDALRLVKGEAWEEGFAMGLLNSLCFFPLLSYGSTAPLASLPGDVQERKDKINKGWEEKPGGRQRLQGTDSDSEDNVLKEFLIAGALLERTLVDCKNEHEKGRLQLAYPILVGRQQPIGHKDYPRMGNYFHVQAGGGRFPMATSPKTNKAVATFLRQHAGFPEAAVKNAEERTVHEAVTNLTKLQGCQMWEHADDLQEVVLSKEQEALIGKGSTGPPVDLAGVQLSEEQKQRCAEGFDKKQLEMLKAEVRTKVPAFHEIIDRAASVGRATEKLGHAMSTQHFTGQPTIAAPLGILSSDLMLLTHSSP